MEASSSDECCRDELNGRGRVPSICRLALLTGRPRKIRVWAQGNVVISIFKRQRFRLLDRDHSRIGFAGNDRNGAFMMVSRPRRVSDPTPRPQSQRHQLASAAPAAALADTFERRDSVLSAGGVGSRIR